MTVVLGTTFLATIPNLMAGDLVGRIAVAKPDQAVVYVETVPGAFHGNRVKIDQRNKEFTPHVLPIVQGTTLEFHNSDDLRHNVFGVGADEFNLGSWAKGGFREHAFNKLGEVVILCDVHPEMEAYVLVLQNSYFAQPDAKGQFRIPAVPAGEYVVKAWYRGKTKKQTVKVPPTGNTTVTF